MFSTRDSYSSNVLGQWFSTFSEPWPFCVFWKFAWPIALWTTAVGPYLCGPLYRKKRSPLSSQRWLPSDCPDLQNKKKAVTSGRAIFALISKKGFHLWVNDFCPISRKKSTSGRAIFALIFKKKGPRIGVPDFCQFSNRYNWNNTIDIFEPSIQFFK